MAEYFEHLFKMGTGWLGWPPAVVLAAPIPQLEMAIAGRQDLLQSIFGKPRAEVPPGQKLQAVFGMIGTKRVQRGTP